MIKHHRREWRVCARRRAVPLPASAVTNCFAERNRSTMIPRRGADHLILAVDRVRTMPGVPKWKPPLHISSRLEYWRVESGSSPALLCQAYQRLGYLPVLSPCWSDRLAFLIRSNPNDRCPERPVGSTQYRRSAQYLSTKLLRRRSPGVFNVFSGCEQIGPDLRASCRGPVR